MREKTVAHNGHEVGKRGFFSSRANIVLLGFLAIAGFYLVAEHRAHVLGFLPFLLLLACPLLHVFMHGGHGGHGGNGRADDDSKQKRPTEPPHEH